MFRPFKEVVPLVVAGASLLSIFVAQPADASLAACTSTCPVQCFCSFSITGTRYPICCVNGQQYTGTDDYGSYQVPKTTPFSTCGGDGCYAWNNIAGSCDQVNLSSSPLGGCG